MLNHTCRDDSRLTDENFVNWMNVMVKADKVKRWVVSNWNFDIF